MTIKILSSAILLAGILACRCEPAYPQCIEPARDDLYEKGIDLFEKGLYADADAVFTRAAREAPAGERLILSEIAAYRALCAIELQLPEAEMPVHALIRDYPENKHRNAITFALANVFFQKKNYKKALAWYDEVDSYGLRYHQHYECQFKKGYCYFELRDYLKASRCFVTVKDAPNNTYSAPATYYFGHTEYSKGNYVSALAAFEKAMEDDRFAGLAPLYLVQIYYLQKAYDKVAAYGARALPAMSPPQDKELLHVLAEAHFQLKNYDQARDYFARYAQGLSKLPRTDDYFVGLIDYRTGSYEAAIGHFEKVGLAANDSLAQNALYHAGDAYLQLGNKTNAQHAFESASKLSSLPAVRQDAWLQYAKLAIELQNDGKPLQAYFEKYPAQAQKPELKAYSAALHILRQEYEKALDDLKSIPSPTDRQQADMQRLHFLIGKSLYDLQDERRYAEVINYMEAAQTIGYDATIAALARYYQADTYFLQRQYKEAQRRFEKFLTGSGTFRAGDEYLAAHYNLGYCGFKLKSYEPAISWFRKFITLAGASHKTQVADAYNRIGDCYYVQKKYWPAAENYNKSIELNADGADYALCRKAFAYGLLGRYESKIKTLSDLAVKHPKSVYAQAGLLELGRTQQQHNRYDEAEEAFMQLLRAYPQSTYKAQTLTELGLLYANTNRPTEAIRYYKQAVEESAPNSPDAKGALEGLKNTYAGIHDLSSYYAYLQQISQEFSPVEKEEALFLAAEKLVNSTNCAQAITSFQQFIADFPQSSYTLQAYAYIGNCYFQSEQYQQAVDAYRHILDDPTPSAYREPARVNATQAYIELEDYDAAVEELHILAQTTADTTIRLSAFIELARILSSPLANFREAANSAQSALSIPRITPAQAREMKLIKANSWKTLGQENAAGNVYAEIVADSLNDQENAEAMFHLIDITFSQDRFEEGEAMVFGFAASDAKIFQYWIARSYIALAGQYAQRGHVTQAKATYNSILSNYKNTTDGILELARRELGWLE
ncbi:MAG: tetratricopeptide repeat protein [Prevotellaceae bacterium]|nr:tetratricopeptide repeat protein [Prevotellaceae bacterium]